MAIFALRWCRRDSHCNTEFDLETLKEHDSRRCDGCKETRRQASTTKKREGRLSMFDKYSEVIDWLIFIAVAPVYVIDAWMRRLDKWM